MAVLTKPPAFIRRRNGGRSDMSHRPNHNIYHGQLPPESAHESQLGQPVDYTAPHDSNRFAYDDTPYMPQRTSYPIQGRHQIPLQPSHPMTSGYNHQEIYPQSQGINIGGQGTSFDQFQSPYSSPGQIDHPQPYAISLPPHSIPSSYPHHRRENSMPYAFPDIPGGNRPSMVHAQSYPGAGFTDDLSITHGFDPDGSQQVGQPIPDPEEYLRQKLALRPGDPINLWSLPEPEPGQRPPHSYPLLVRLAIYGSPNKRMTLKQIYEAIENRFEYYRNQPKGAWKGSIRHNLSLNQVFRNVHRPLTEPGKGNYWEIDHSRGEGYKRDRKRKSRRTRTGDDSRARSDDDDYGFDDSLSELEMGLVDSDHSDGSGNHAGPSSSRASRRASPYQSPSAGARRLESSGRYGVSSSGGMTGSPIADQYYASSPEGSAYSGSSFDGTMGRRDGR